MQGLLRRLFGIPESPPKAHILFVDGENSPPPPDLLVDAVTSHANSDLELSLAYGKWWPNSNHTRSFREAGIECIQADEGSNNADIMLSLRAQKEVSERARYGQGGIAYVAFFSDKGFSHLLREIRITKGWKSVYVTSNEDPPSILVQSSSEVLYVRESDEEKKPVKSSPSTKRRRRPKKEVKSTTLDWSELDTSKKDELEKLLISLIGEGSVNVATLGNRIIAYQKNNGLQDTGSKILLKEFGLTGSLNKVITQEFSEKISAKATSFRTSPTTGENVPTSFEYSVKRMEFEDIILELIGKDQINSHTLSSRIIAYQKAHDWEETGKRAINQKFGFPLGRSYKVSIEKLLPERVEITGDVPRYDYRVKNEQSLEEE